MSANTLKKMFMTVAVAGIAMVAVAGSLQGGSRFIAGSTAAVSDDVTGHGYYRSSVQTPYAVFDGLE
jgi:hypothetical protein